MVLLIRCIWDGPQIRGGGLTTLTFNNALGQAQACVDAVEDYWTAALARINSQNGVTISSQVSEFDAATGELLAVTGVTAPTRQPGGFATAALPPATQGLVRLVTGGIRNNRIVRGRVFLPAPAESDNNADGTVGTTYKTVETAAAQQLADDLTATWAVWSRPVAGSGGAVYGVTAVSVSDQWAVLRSRRD